MTRHDGSIGCTTSPNPKSSRQANINACPGKSTAPINSISSSSPSSRTTNARHAPLPLSLLTAREGRLSANLLVAGNNLGIWPLPLVQAAVALVRLLAIPSILVPT